MHVEMTKIQNGDCVYLKINSSDKLIGQGKHRQEHILSFFLRKHADDR